MPGSTAVRERARDDRGRSAVTMKAVEDEPSVTKPSSTIQASNTPASRGLLLRQHLGEEGDGLDVPPFPAQVRRRDNGDAGLGLRRAGDRPSPA